MSIQSYTNLCLHVHTIVNYIFVFLTNNTDVRIEFKNIPLTGTVQGQYVNVCYTPYISSPHDMSQYLFAITVEGGLRK
jgi:hypothetical protein